MKVLVTGADGFIGSHLTEQLVRSGHSVKAMVLYNSFGSCGWLDHCAEDVQGQFETFPGDIRDSYRVSQAISDCNVVCHLAALIAIPYSYVAAESFVDTNVRGTLNLLQEAKRHSIDRFIHTSTSEVYGSAQVVPITEDHPLNAQSPYAASKIAADQMVNAFHASYDLPTVTVRPFNTYGPRQSARAVIPTVITQIAAGRPELHLGDLTPTRDFSYISDTVNGYLCAIRSNQGIGGTFNLGNGFDISIGDTVKMICELMGRHPEIKADEARFRPEQSEVTRLCSDPSRAAESLGWQPEYGGRDGLKRGLEKTIDWFTQPENLASYKTDRFNI